MIISARSAAHAPKHSGLDDDSRHCPNPAPPTSPRTIHLERLDGLALIQIVLILLTVIWWIIVIQ